MKRMGALVVPFRGKKKSGFGASPTPILFIWEFHPPFPPGLPYTFTGSTRRGSAAISAARILSISKACALQKGNSKQSHKYHK